MALTRDDLIDVDLQMATNLINQGILSAMPPLKPGVEYLLKQAIRQIQKAQKRLHVTPDG